MGRPILPLKRRLVGHGLAEPNDLPDSCREKSDVNLNTWVWKKRSR